jgi:uncharacterized protein YjbJ (UPF0337 family)
MGMINESIASSIVGQLRRLPYPGRRLPTTMTTALTNATEKSARARCERRFPFMRSSTKDKIKGSLQEAKGKVKEESGKAIGNPNLRDRGTGEKVAGKVQKKIGDVKKVFGA